MTVPRQLSEKVAGSRDDRTPLAEEEQQYRGADSRNAAEATPDPGPKDEKPRKTSAANHVGSDLAVGQERDLAAAQWEGGDGGATQQAGRDLAVSEELDPGQRERRRRATGPAGRRQAVAHRSGPLLRDRRDSM
jgi:hypothetical protein